ncbi:hypothetical protein BDF22DRAFT_663513 [Syncephalis plumigaleata]|nr:hypothetical protein BDF22DRAFT_663513 [Syncephalis plumigaleata]
MVLSGDKQWPGCSVIECWESEIQQCFEDTTSVEQMLEKLEQQGKPWMQATVKYIHSLPPLLVKIMYRAIREASQLNWQRCNELELLIARNWSKSIDAHRLRNLQVITICY